MAVRIVETLNLSIEETKVDPEPPKVELKREEWLVQKVPNWSIVNTKAPKAKEVVNKTGKTETSPLLEPAKIDVLTYHVPKAEDTFWVPAEKFPQSVPFQTLIVPFEHDMPSPLITESEELRAKIGQTTWNKLEGDAKMIASFHQQQDWFYDTYNGIFLYLCLPCFWICIYRPNDELIHNLSYKWKAYFDEKNIAFTVSFKPGSIQSAILNRDVTLAQRTYAFVIDIEKLFINAVKPEKTPSKDCSCICFDTSPGAK